MGDAWDWTGSVYILQLWKPAPQQTPVLGVNVLSNVFIAPAQETTESNKMICKYSI
jgi:hypothetical protein